MKRLSTPYRHRRYVMRELPWDLDLCPVSSHPDHLTAKINQFCKAKRQVINCVEDDVASLIAWRKKFPRFQSWRLIFCASGWNAPIFYFLWDCLKFLKISEDLKTCYNILIFKVVFVWTIFLYSSRVSNDCNMMNFCQWLNVKVCAPIHVICHFHTFI